MVEAIQCPSCQTRYGLRPARVRTGLRRAQCFRCGDIFHIDAEVKKLLAEVEPVSTSSVPLSVLAEAMQQAPEAQASLEAQDLTLGDLDIPEPDFEAPSAPSPNETAPIPSMAAAAAIPEIPEIPAPEPPAPEASSPEPEPGGTYASAKDAIARLFGDTPLAPSPTAAIRGALSSGRDLDTEAGMKALEDTLGGVPASALSTKPFIAPVPDVPADLLAAPEAPMQETDLPHASATVRLSAAEVAAAAGSVTSKAPEPPEITQEEVTMVLPPPPTPTPVPPMDTADPSALRLRIGDQVYGGLDLATIAKWIEEGRVLEDHQVARGTSENWMDAAKVPALRPVFERLRRARMGGDLLAPPSSSIGDTGAKKGLFGGMFGKKD